MVNRMSLVTKSLEENTLTQPKTEAPKKPTSVRPAPPPLWQSRPDVHLWLVKCKVRWRTRAHRAVRAARRLTGAPFLQPGKGNQVVMLLMERFSASLRAGQSPRIFSVFTTPSVERHVYVEAKTKHDVISAFARHRRRRRCAHA